MEDTIAAIATALGEGGIGIVRISGPRARDILSQVFVFAGEHSQIISRRMTYGRIVDQEKGQLIDECMAVYMKGPKTYTAEDVVEISCHGSTVSLRNTLDLVLRCGARLAEPGEFTKRAFLNGRIDLSQAEAVMDLVRAKTDRSFDVAMQQLSGGLSLRVSDLRKSLLDLLVDITVNIDYPDEDIEEITYEGLEDQLVMIRESLDRLLATADTGRMLREGIRVVICGRPNVGKSSLLNGMLRENRAIVTDIPGTTRDTIEELVSIRDIPLVLVDTAGIHETSDTVEQLGIQRSKDAFNHADYILLVLDASQSLQPEDLEIISYIGKRRCLAVLNKQDLGSMIEEENIHRVLPGASIIRTVLSGGEGFDAIDAIEDHLVSQVYGGQLSQQESVLVNNVRHIDLLRRAHADISTALDMSQMREPLDFIEVDVRSAYDALGEIIGETVSEDILNEVFSRFCLGK